MGGIFQLMKYLEELEPGDCFEFENHTYLTLCDYKKNGQRCCVILKSGSTRWLEPDIIVDICPIYKLDEDNNVIAIKQIEQQHV